MSGFKCLKESIYSSFSMKLWIIFLDLGWGSDLYPLLSAEWFRVQFKSPIIILCGAVPEFDIVCICSQKLFGLSFEGA